MGSRKTRLAGLLIAALGVIGTVGSTTGVAQAVVLNRLSPAYPDDSTCTAARASLVALPDVEAASACFFSQADPALHIPSPGWYFRYAMGSV
jgi:hypothetical protein